MFSAHQFLINVRAWWHENPAFVSAYACIPCWGSKWVLMNLATRAFRPNQEPSMGRCPFFSKLFYKRKVIRQVKQFVYLLTSSTNRSFYRYLGTSYSLVISLTWGCPSILLSNRYKGESSLLHIAYSMYSFRVTLSFFPWFVTPTLNSASLNRSTSRYREERKKF